MELIAAARHLIGNGKFPKSEDARDLLLRDALRIWHHALALVGDFDAAGNPAIEMNLHERQEHREKWVNRSGPPMIGDETIKYITNGDRDKRAIPKLEGWLKSGNVPWGVNTLDKLKAPLDRGAVEFLRHCFLKHEADRISAQNAVKGQLAAEMAATKKLRIATEKKASEKRPR